FETFAKQVKKHLATDATRQSGYTFTERRTEQKLDAEGRATDQAVKVFESFPGLPREGPYRRPTAGNGTRGPSRKRPRHGRDRQKDVESDARKLSSAAEREKAARALEKERQRYAAAVDDVFRIYDIRMVRRESIEGHDTILATLTPKVDAKPQTDDGKIMRHF